jgi:hypothetical protein
MCRIKCALFCDRLVVCVRSGGLSLELRIGKLESVVIRGMLEGGTRCFGAWSHSGGGRGGCWVFKVSTRPFAGEIIRETGPSQHR